MADTEGGDEVRRTPEVNKGAADPGGATPSPPKTPAIEVTADMDNDNDKPKDAAAADRQDSSKTPTRVNIAEPTMAESARGRDSATPAKTGENTEARSSRSKKKRWSAPPGAHKVTFTVTIAQAIPSAGEEDRSPDGRDTAKKKKKRVVEAPRAQNYYHLEYMLLPEDDDYVKTDVVTFGMAAKIYTERQEPKVLKSWQAGDVTWVAWTHCHTVAVTEELLHKLHTHTMELRVWDTKDKVSTRARFDRPRAFRFPPPKPGEDADSVGGVKTLVMKQSASYEKMQPKRPYINRLLPSQMPAMADVEESEQEPQTQAEKPAPDKRARTRTREQQPTKKKKVPTATLR